MHDSGSDVRGVGVVTGGAAIGADPGRFGRPGSPIPPPFKTMGIPIPRVRMAARPPDTQRTEARRRVISADRR